ncbi:MAG: hypothetical protein ACKVW3_13140 [Phycisphaerales bacterium]
MTVDPKTPVLPRESAGPQTSYERFREALLNAGCRVLWNGVPFHGCKFRLVSFSTPRGALIVRVFLPEDGGFEVYASSAIPRTIDERIEWALSQPTASRDEPAQPAEPPLVLTGPGGEFRIEQRSCRVCSAIFSAAFGCAGELCQNCLDRRRAASAAYAPPSAPATTNVIA